MLVLVSLAVVGKGALPWARGEPVREAGEAVWEAGEGSLVGDPASTMPSSLEMEGSEHLESSMGGEGGGCGS